ncbi:MAG: hypothetical protein A2Z51_09470 [Deltaproteobacteria bacterium RBG_19FT_COMBO_52_11]|nr:MAG: hypothetical protein A2Z51_09470 [Deltaproteobacteria bacterium RBG_19FT_COMBO_52_11]
MKALFFILFRRVPDHCLQNIIPDVKTMLGSGEGTLLNFLFEFLQGLHDLLEKSCVFFYEFRGEAIEKTE